MKHTPTPWHYTPGNPMVYGASTDSKGGGRQEVALAREVYMNRSERETNAAHIVKCVNLHDELVEALKDALFMAMGPGETINAREIAEAWKKLLVRAEAE